MKKSRKYLEKRKKKILVILSLVTVVCYVLAMMKITNFSENSTKLKTKSLAESSESITISAISDVGENTVITNAKVVGGYNNFIALSATGKVYTWGLNNYGQLGTNDLQNRLTPVEPLMAIENADGSITFENITDAVDVAAGNNHTLVLRQDGTVWCTGYNNYGQLGTGDTVNVTTFKQVKLNANGEKLENVIAITAQEDTSYALLKDGTVWGWGYNGQGQYGTNSSTNSNHPVKNENVSNIKQISAGGNYICMLDESGTVWCQGTNASGQFGTKNSTSSKIPVQMLDTDSTVLTGVKEVATGINHTVVLKEDGTVWAVGYNLQGQLGQGNTTTVNYIKQVQYQDGVTDVITDAVHVFASGRSTYIQKSTGGMYVIGYNSNGQLFTNDSVSKKYAVPVQTDKQIISMAMTKNYSSQTGAIVDSEGKIYTVGYNSYGEIGNGNTIATKDATCITKAVIDVTPKIVKFNNIGETSEKINAKLKVENNLLKENMEGETFECYSEDTNVATLNDNGNIVATGNGSTYIKIYNKTENIAEVIRVSVNRKEGEIKPKITGGYNFFVALEKNGTVWTWGSNSYGQLGINNSNFNEPVAVQAKETITLEDGTKKEQEITNITDIATGDYYTLALKRDGTVWSTGYNSYGQLGNGNRESKTTFEQVKLNVDGENLQNIIAISAGDNSSYALAEDGTIWAWGDNGNGQLGQGDTNTQCYPVKMNTTSTIVKISAGDSYVAMLDASGRVWSVGYNSYGQFGIGNTTSSNIPVQMLDENGNELKNVKDIATGTNYTMILKQDGSVWGTGANTRGELGIGNVTTQSTIAQVIDTQKKPVTNVKNVYASGSSTYLTLETGMYVIGYNNYGQLYTEDKIARSTATLVQEDKKIITVAALRYNSQASAIATQDGNVYTVGYNVNCELGNGNSINTITENLISKYEIKANPVAINYNQIGQNSENVKATVTLPLNLMNQEVTSNNFTYSSIDESVAIVDSNGTVTAKGQGSTFIKIHNEENDVTASVYVNVKTEEKSEIKIVSGDDHFAALKQDGKIYTWGYNAYGQLATKDNNARVEPEEAKETIILEGGNTKTQDITNVKDIAAGYDSTVALKNDGTVWIAGYNTTGNNNTFEKMELNANGEYLQNIIAISAGENTVYALSENGTVWAWGLNDYGQLGCADATNKVYPVKVKSISNIIQIEAGKSYIAMLAVDGTVWTSGYNDYGQLGINNVTSINAPKQMVNADGTIVTGVKKIATGVDNTIVLKEDGTVWSTGYNNAGQLGDGTTTNRATLVQVKEDTNNVITSVKDIYAGGYSVYLLKEIDNVEKLYVMGNNNKGQLFTENTTNSSYAIPVNIDKKIKSIAASTTNAAIVSKDGMIYTVGANSYGQLGNATTVDTIVKECINKPVIKNTSNSIIYNSIGDNNQKVSQKILIKYNLITEEIEGKTFKYSSANENVATVTEDGTVTATGVGTTVIKAYNEEYDIYSGVKVIVNTEATKVEPKIESGENYFVSLKSDGTVWSWGYNGNGECANGSNYNVVEPTKVKQTTYLEDGSKKVENITDVIDISAGRYHSIVLKSDGTVWTVGYNDRGQLGDGTTTSKYTYEQVKLNENGEYLQNIVAISAGTDSSYALAADGTVWSWGGNSYGQLGLGYKEAKTYPQKMINMQGIIDIKAGRYYATMLSADGSVWGVGYNSYGQLGTGDTTNVSIPAQMKNADKSVLYGVKEISVEYGHTILLKEDNTVWGVGYNTHGELGDGTTTRKSYPVQIKTIVNGAEEPLTNVKKIYASGYSTYIQKGEDTYATGYNNYGQLCTGDTTNLSYATKIQEDKKIITITTTQNGTTAFADSEGMIFTCGYNANNQLGNNTIENTTTPTRISDIYIKLDEKIVNLKVKGDTKKIDYVLGVRFNLFKDEIEKTSCTYKTMDANIATVTSDGKITAGEIGSTYIKMYNEKNDIYETVTVNVNSEQGSTAPKVAAGTNHFVALKSNGTVYTWGHNNYGQLGTNDNINRQLPTIPRATTILEDGTTKEEEITDAIDVAAGNNHTIILRKDGTVWSAGNNGNGKLGIGNTSTSSTFKQVKLMNNASGYLQNVVAITAGENNTYAVTKEGYVYAWGYNGNGQIGINFSDNTNYTYATRMKLVSNIMQISAGQSNVIMLEKNGTVWSVGNNGYGQLGTNNTMQMSVPTQMLDASGTVLTNVKEISAGLNHTLIQKEDGTVLAVGYNSYGQLGQGTTTNVGSLTQVLEARATPIKNTKHIYASGNSNFISMQNDGMYAIGYNNAGGLFTQDITNKLYASKVETDRNILLASNTLNGTGIIVDADGMIYTAGTNSHGELGDGTTQNSQTKKRVTQKKIKAEKITMDLDTIGQTEQIKFTMELQYNLLREILPESVTTFTSEDENVATVSTEGLVTAKAVGSTNIKVYNETNNLWATIKVNVQKENIKEVEPKIVGGMNYLVALKANETAWTWGSNSYGELGIGNNINQSEPVIVKTLITNENGETIEEEITGIVDIAAGYQHTLLLSRDGTVWASGNNSYGQLGNGNIINSNYFYKVKLNEAGENLKDIVKIGAGNYSSYAVTNQGEVYAWGRNSYGTLDQGITDSDPHSYPVKMQNANGIIAVDAEYDYMVMLDYNRKSMGVRLWLWTIWSRKYIYNDKTNKNVRYRWK